MPYTSKQTYLPHSMQTDGSETKSYVQVLNPEGHFFATVANQDVADQMLDWLNDDPLEQPGTVLVAHDFADVDVRAVESASSHGAVNPMSYLVAGAAVQLVDDKELLQTWVDWGNNVVIPQLQKNRVELNRVEAADAKWKQEFGSALEDTREALTVFLADIRQGNQLSDGTYCWCDDPEFTDGYHSEQCKRIRAAIAKLEAGKPKYKNPAGDQCCAHCGSSNVMLDAWFHVNLGETTTFDQGFCEQCDGETNIITQAEYDEAQE